MMDSIAALFFLTCSLGIVTTTMLAYFASGRRPEARFVLVLSLLLIAALFAFSPVGIALDKVQAPLVQTPEASQRAGL